MRVYLIRHGQTKGNQEGRMVGRTDEPLSEAGKTKLARQMYPAAGILFVSPMIRCRQSAEILYPQMAPTVVTDLRECDFGDFEYRTYEDLSKDPAYIAWAQGGYVGVFPGGEAVTAFKRRCVAAFSDCLAICGSRQIDTAAFVIHGGGIMSIMEAYASPRGAYYDFQVGNGEGYELTVAMDGAGPDRVCPGSSAGGSGMAAPSGAPDGTSDRGPGKNYQKYPA